MSQFQPVGVPTTDYFLVQILQGSGRGPRKRLRIGGSSEAIETYLNIKIVAAQPGVAVGSGISRRAPSPVCPRTPRNGRGHCAITGFRQSFRYRSVQCPDAGAAGRSHDREDRASYRHRICSSETDPGGFGRGFPAADPRLDRPLDPGPRTLFIASNLAFGFTISTLARNQMPGHPAGTVHDFAADPAVGLSLPVPRLVDLGAIDRRGVPDDAHPTGRPRYHLKGNTGAEIYPTCGRSRSSR
jgi:hypothetical protein